MSNLIKYDTLKALFQQISVVVSKYEEPTEELSTINNIIKTLLNNSSQFENKKAYEYFYDDFLFGCIKYFLKMIPPKVVTPQHYHLAELVKEFLLLLVELQILDQDNDNKRFINCFRVILACDMEFYKYYYSSDTISSQETVSLISHLKTNSIQTGHKL